MSIERYFTDNYFDRVKKDFKFLVTIVNNSMGEYDLSIRENYFNLYFKGYSIGKIQPTRNKSYRITIHKKFINDTDADDQKLFEISKKPNNAYWSINLTSKQLHPFFQKKHLTQFASRVNNEPYGELAFEQAIMTDNLHRSDIIIIDRQITDNELKRKRLDLLALKQIKGTEYHFLLLEVKLGKNPELKGQVKSQLEGYIKHVDSHFKEYKKCYEVHYTQKVGLGLIKEPRNIEIIKPVIGQILVGSYSGIANESIGKLIATYPNLSVKHFKYVL